MTHNNAELKILTPNEIVVTGDVKGNTGRTTVIGIQGNAVSAATPSQYNTLSWITANSDWEPSGLVTLVNFVHITSVASGSNYNVQPLDACIMVTDGSSATNINLPATARVGRTLFITFLNGYAPGTHTTPANPFYVNSQAGSVIQLANTGSSQTSSSFNTNFSAILTCYDGINWTAIGV